MKSFLIRSSVLLRNYSYQIIEFLSCRLANHVYCLRCLLLQLDIYTTCSKLILFDYDHSFYFLLIIHCFRIPFLQFFIWFLCAMLKFIFSFLTWSSPLYKLLTFYIKLLLAPFVPHFITRSYRFGLNSLWEFSIICFNWFHNLFAYNFPTTLVRIIRLSWLNSFQFPAIDVCLLLFLLPSELCPAILLIIAI